jgi:hypothetical protein
MDEIKTLPDRDIKFIYGHKLENIEIINSDLRLNTKIVSTRTVRLQKEYNESQRIKKIT